jgi:hypothetical protein
MVGCLVGWLVASFSCLEDVSPMGWLVGWLIGWLVGWLIGWLLPSVVWRVLHLWVGWLVGGMAGWLVGWLVGC